MSWGGSVTLKEIGLIDQIYQGNFTIIDRDKAQTIDERYDLMRQALLCDTYLTSFNAISEDGILVNVDSVGNRVAAKCYSCYWDVYAVRQIHFYILLQRHFVLSMVLVEIVNPRIVFVLTLLKLECARQKEE
ncbi:LUD domain-containing protein [Paenibacillus sp. J2TS4]|uniref:LUD domain-containing protein n=1 Tax=Paenibacillus sp. J2TS4 TaxID=2807194 RepID=UPI001B0F26B7|nr:hypothetical protein J2TS4_58130 [Paenibacillus sp. J2TS4]